MCTHLLALPYAGGSSYSYNFLKKVLPGEIKLHTIEYPGRGSRAKEQLVNNAEELLADILRQYRSFAANVPDDRIVLYGHSLGATLGLELLHNINQAFPWHMPSEAIFTGQGAPRTIERKKMSQLPEKELIDYFVKAGGISQEAAIHPELMAYLLPVLRNDLYLLEQYSVAYTMKLNIPLVVMVGTEENISEYQFKAWEQETNGKTKLYKLNGNHFFINHDKLFPAIITQICTRQANAILT